MKRMMATALALGAAAAWVAPQALAQGTNVQQPSAQRAPAQQGPGSQQPRAQQPARPATPPAARPTEAPQTDPARANGSAQLRQRIEQLEEQLVDMQVAVGTLESFAKTSAGRATTTGSIGATGGGAGGADAARVDGMETQVRALASQIDQLTQQMRTLEARLGAAPAGGVRPPEQRGDAAGTAGSGFPPAIAAGGAATRPPRAPAASVPVTEKGDDDTIAGLIKGDGAADAQPRAPGQTALAQPPLGRPPVQAPAAVRPQTAAATPVGNPRELYERAYGNLLQQDYGAAEKAFAEFLSQHPSHDLSGNAQYWLGESFYVRGQYRQAASAFLKGYQTYGKSQKAPDSLLKLGMSLDRLGQKDAACSSLAELSTRFPTAPAHLQSRAQSERVRIGCP